MKTMQRMGWTLAFAAMVATGCKTMNRQQKGTVIGASGGGAIGAVIGKKMGNTAAGAVIGAAIGGAAGNIIGRRMDRQAEEMEKVLGDAEVRREGEGIVINFKEKVLFAYNEAALSGTSQTNLEKLSNILKKYPETNIQIIGHTDSKGSASYNNNLSERRATAVAGFLRGQSIPAARITTMGMGESDPVASNDSDEGRSLNRRVEFVITANETMKQDARREAGN